MLRLLPSRACMATALLITLACLPAVSAWKCTHSMTGLVECCCNCQGKVCQGHYFSKKCNETKYAAHDTEETLRNAIAVGYIRNNHCACFEARIEAIQESVEGIWKCNGTYQCPDEEFFGDAVTATRQHPYIDEKQLQRKHHGELKYGCLSIACRKHKRGGRYWHSMNCTVDFGKILRPITHNGTYQKGECDKKCRCPCKDCYRNKSNPSFYTLPSSLSYQFRRHADFINGSNRNRRLADTFADCAVCGGSGKTRSLFFLQPCDNCLGIGKVRD